MKVEKVHEGIRYTLSNDDLQVGDLVFPIGWGRCTEDDGWVLHEIKYKHTGFPDEPHTILDLHHSDYKPYEVRTNYGYSPKESYYKIIKKEIQKRENDKLFSIHKWVEIE